MLTAGQHVGEYILAKRIGNGAFGEVWQAHHHASADQVVAMKIPTDPQYLQCLRNENEAIRKLSHRNIVSALAFDPFSNPPYLVMEYVAGGNLRAKMSRGSLPMGETLTIMRQILAGLKSAHWHGVTHGDIKPENILLSNEIDAAGNKQLLAKLTDFGTGNTMSRNLQSILISQDPRERKVLAATQAYMAPEQAESGSTDPRVDLYACGVLYFEMLTGRRPAGHELPSELNPAVPRWMDIAFQSSYARLDQRVKSAQAFTKLLDVPVPDLTPKPMPAAAALPPRKPSKTWWKRRYTLYVVGAFLMVVFGEILIRKLYTPPRRPPEPTPLPNWEVR